MTIQFRIDLAQFSPGGVFEGEDQSKTAIGIGNFFTGKRYTNHSAFKTEYSRALRVDAGGTEIRDDLFEVAPDETKAILSEYVYRGIMIVAQDGTPLTPNEILHFGYDDVKVIP